jgi:hypothetical protein
MRKRALDYLDCNKTKAQCKPNLQSKPKKIVISLLSDDEDMKKGDESKNEEDEDEGDEDDSSQTVG